MRANNFDLLRIIATLCVFISHGLALYAKQEPTLLTSASGLVPINLGVYGVSIFFAISGYLIMQSCLQSGNIVRFAWKRVLRLYPALALNCFVTIAIIIPITTDIGLRQYFTQVMEDIGGIIHSLLVLAAPDVRNAFPGSFIGLINGSLWTLPIEAMCYGIAGAIGLIRWRKLLFPLCFAACLILYYRQVSAPADTLSLKYLYMLIFFIAAGFFLYRAYIPLNAPLAIFCIVVQAALFSYDWYLLPLYALSTVYLTLYAALQLRPLGNIARYGDFSYGIYIYAWPIQQTFGILFTHTPEKLPIYMLLSFFWCFACAFISWHLVEKRALLLAHATILRKSLPS